jgi:hypothetical protein
MQHSTFSNQTMNILILVGLAAQNRFCGCGHGLHYWLGNGRQFRQTLISIYKRVKKEKRVR